MHLKPSQAAEFIRESNAIEGYWFPLETTVEAWHARGKGFDKALSGHTRALHTLTTSPRWGLSANLSFTRLEALHTQLMGGLLPKNLLGFRRLRGVRVREALCPPGVAVRPMLRTWFSIVNKLQQPTEYTVWQTHLAFEHIHPFHDGNGRVGRLIWLWLRFKHGLGYAVVQNDTKIVDYYPQFGDFSWSRWCANASS